jgi:hypothetical protein
LDWLELFRSLVGEVPGDLGSVAGVVGLVGAGDSSVAAEMTPAEIEFGEDADRGAAGAAERKDLVVFAPVGRRGDRSQGDLEGLGRLDVGRQFSDARPVNAETTVRSG